MLISKVNKFYGKFPETLKLIGRVWGEGFAFGAAFGIILSIIFYRG